MWRGPPLELFPLWITDTTSMQFVKKVNYPTVPFVVSWPLHLPSSSTLTYTHPLHETQTHARTHPPPSVIHPPPCTSAAGGERHIKSEGLWLWSRRNISEFRSYDQLPPPVLSITSLDLWLVWAASYTHSHTLPHTLSVGLLLLWP